MSSYQSYVTNSRKCGPGQIKVTRRGTARAKGTTYCATDRGKPGRGPKKIPTPRPGALGGPGYTQKSERTRHGLLRTHNKKYGYASTISALQSRINLGKRTMSPAALRVFRADKTWVQSALKPKERNAMATKRKGRGSSAGLRKAKAVRGAMALGVSKMAANKLYDEGKLTPTGKPKKGARGIPQGMKSALGPSKKKTTKKRSKKKTSKKKTTKKRSKKKTTRSVAKQVKKAPPRRATKKRAKKSSARKRSSYKQHGKSLPRSGGRSLRASKTKKGSVCFKKGRKGTVTKAVSKAANRVREGKQGQSGRPLAYQRWCRNFMNLNIPEGDLGSFE